MPGEPPALTQFPDHLPRAPRPPLPEADAVHVWCAAIDLPASGVRALEKTLARDELARGDGFRFRRDRDRFVAARGILRAILARYVDVSPDQLRFRYGPYGKPALNSALDGDVRFNVAHAGGLAVYAVATRREVGIDLEHVRSHPFDEQVAAQYFSAQETAMLRGLPPRERQEAFLRLWTRKEACLKARGAGLAMCRGDECASPACEPTAARVDGSVRQRASQWCVRDLDPEPGYVAALAVEGGSCRVRFGWWPC